MVLAPGVMVGERYQIGMLLGKGGFGATYLGWDHKLAVRVAVKEFLPFGVVQRGSNGLGIEIVSGDRESYQLGLERFLGEARTLARFRSFQNVVSVFDFFPANGTAYIIMEFISGQTLKAYLRSRPGHRLPLIEGWLIFRGLLEALRELHDQGLLHRDVSPDNVMLTERHSVKLLDFGAARQVMMHATQKMSVIVKPGYAPYEQYLENGNQGPWSDLYAAAATFYQMLTGEKPPDALQRMASDDLAPPSRRGVKLGPRAEQALMRALAVRADARFSTVDAFMVEMAADMPDAAIAGGVGSAAAAKPAGGARAPAVATSAPVPLPPVQPAPGQAAPVQPAPAIAQPLASSSMSLPPLQSAASSAAQGMTRAQPSALAEAANAAAAVGARSISPPDLSRALRDHMAFLGGKRQGRCLNMPMHNLSGFVMRAADFSRGELRGTIWIGCDLAGSRFRGADLFCADFRKSRLQGCDFTNADLRGANFDDADLNDAVLDGANCRDGILLLHQANGELLDVQKERLARTASFAGAKLKRASFRKSELEAANFERADLEQAHFERANLAKASFNSAVVANAAFEGANLDRANFVHADLRGVAVSAPEFANARIVRRLDEIADELRLCIVEHQRWVETLAREGKRLFLNDCDLSGLQMPGVDWSAAEFTRVDLHDVDLSRARLSMTVFNECILSRTVMSGADARGVTLLNCRLVGADLSACDLSPVVSVARKDRKWPARVTGCDMTDAILTGANCTEAVFRNTNLGGANLVSADLSQTDLSGVNFRGAVLTGTSLEGAKLQGAQGLPRHLNR